MTDRLDDILSGEESLTPPPHFLPSVMEKVRQDQESFRPIPFPWPRLAIGVACSLAMGWMGTWLAPEGTLGSALLPATTFWANWVALAGNPATWAAGVVVGSGLLVRLSLEFTAD